MTRQDERNQADRVQGIRNPERRRFLGSMALGAAALSFCGAAYANQIDDLETLECEVPVRGWPRSHDGFTIGQITDMHCDNADALSRVHLAVARIVQSRPDVSVVTGDYASVGSSDYLEPGIAALRPLTALPGGAFAILGNHDFYGSRENKIVTFLGATGIRLLRNESAAIPGVPDAFFVGLDDVLEGKPDLAAAVKPLPPAALRILLVHEPDFADTAGPGFALQLSGHSHGGQVRVPGLPPIHEPALGRRYPEGLQMGAHFPIYTSKGVGVTGIPLRLYCRPDITLIRLRSA